MFILQWIMPHKVKLIKFSLFKEFSPLDHSTPSSLTDTISLSSSESDLRELGITTGRNRSSKEDMSSSATKAASMSEAAKEVIESWKRLILIYYQL